MVVQLGGVSSALWYCPVRMSLQCIQVFMLSYGKFLVFCGMHVQLGRVSSVLDECPVQGGISSVMGYGCLVRGVI